MKNRKTCLTLILLTWRIWWAPNIASRWEMGFNLAFKGSIESVEIWKVGITRTITISIYYVSLGTFLLESTKMFIGTVTYSRTDLLICHIFCYKLRGTEIGDTLAWNAALYMNKSEMKNSHKRSEIYYTVNINLTLYNQLSYVRVTTSAKKWTLVCSKEMSTIQQKKHCFG